MPKKLVLTQEVRVFQKVNPLSRLLHRTGNGLMPGTEIVIYPVETVVYDHDDHEGVPFDLGSYRGCLLLREVDISGAVEINDEELSRLQNREWAII